MKDFEKLLDTVYELEGLIHLAVVRDLPPATLTSLIKRKAKEVCDVIDNIPDEIPVSENDTPEPTVQSEPFPEEEETDEYALDDTDDYLSDITDLPEIEEEYDNDEPVVESQVVKTDLSGQQPPVKLSFSINDRFRFRRTLFRNSDRDFNLAVASISACSDYNDAYDMLINEYGWDEEDAEVQDFLRLINNYFKYKK